MSSGGGACVEANVTMKSITLLASFMVAASLRWVSCDQSKSPSS